MVIDTVAAFFTDGVRGDESGGDARPARPSGDGETREERR